MRVRHVPMTFLAALGLWPTALAGEPLQPLKAWNLDYGETQCLAARQFGRVEDPVTLAIRPAPNGDTYELLLGQKRPGPNLGEEMQGSVDFGRGPIKAWLLHFGPKGQKFEIYQYRITSIEMAQARTASAVTLRTKGGPSWSLQLANMTNLISGLEQCTADLRSYWNMNPPDKAKLSVGSRGDVRPLFNSTDYPSEALWRGQEGRAQYQLLIDQAGKVAACHVLIPSGIPALDVMGCQVIRLRAKFTPALDLNGKPVRSSYITPFVVWRTR